MPSTSTRKIEVFAIHAHNGPTAVGNYREIFEAFQALPTKRRLYQDREKLIAVPRVRVTTSESFFVAFEGPIGLKPLIYNSANSQERIEDLAEAEVLATKTHILVDFAAREAYIEFNQQGARAKDIAICLMEALNAVDRWKNLSLGFQPVAGEAFFQALQQFTRVRLASVKLARPNYDWTDHHDHLSEMANESEAGTLEVTASARRGGSLSKRHGIVSFIRRMAENRRSALEQARITGRREGEPAETTISLDKFVEHHKVQVGVDDSGHVVTADMREHLYSFMDQRRRARK